MATKKLKSLPREGGEEARGRGPLEAESMLLPERVTKPAFCSSGGLRRRQGSGEGMAGEEMEADRKNSSS